MTVTARPLSAGHARDHPVMEIVPNKALSLSLRLSLRVSRAPAHIGPSNACPRAAPETTPLWRLFLIKLSLSLSLSYYPPTLIRARG